MTTDSLLRYHPERYRRTRPFAKEVAKLYRSIAGVGPPTGKLIESITRVIQKEYNEVIRLIPRESRPRDMRMFMREPAMACSYGAFCAYGRNIFQLTAGLVYEFLHTDVESIPIGLVDFPYQCLYLSFGSQEQLSLYEGERYVDGAYVFVFDRFPLEIHLTSSSRKGNYSSRFEWIVTPDGYYYMSLERKDPLATFGELINKALESELKTHRETADSVKTGVYEVGQ